MTDYSKMKMPELRKMYPGIKAVNKRDFIRRINELEAAQAEEVEESGKLGNKLGRTGTVKAKLTAAKDPKPTGGAKGGRKETSAEGKPLQSYEKGKSGTHPHLDPDKTTGRAEDKPPQSEEKGKSGPHPHDDPNKDTGKSPTDNPIGSGETPETPVVADVQTENELVARYKISSSDYLATVYASEDEAKIVVGDKKSNYYKLLHLRKNGATRTLKSSRELTYNQFCGSVITSSYPLQE